MDDSSNSTPEIVKALTKPTEKFLCSFADNTFGIKFGAFRIRDMDSGFVLVDVPEQDTADQITPEMDDPKFRLVKYHFGPDFLRLKTIGLKVEFKVGDQPVPNLQMIERHYFKGKVIKSYDFKFGFCIPGSTNTLEVIYDLPKLTEAEKEEMV